MDLIERDVPLQELDAAWRAAADGGCLVLVCGEAGIGKTALVHEFLSRLGTPAPPYWGACDALFTPRPLGPLYDMASQLGDEIAPLLHEGANRPGIFSTFLQVLQRKPTLVVIEDIHWADEATLDLLKYVARRIHLTRSLLLLTYRDDEIGAQHPLRLLLGDLATSQAVRRITLEPLSTAGVAQLTGERSVDASALHKLTGGNPFFVTEALAAGIEFIPPTVRDAVLSRAARLSLSGRAVLDAAAIVGPRIEPWLLAEVTRAESESIGECLELGILQPLGKALAFRHELARQIILENIPAHRRAFLHQATLDALRNAPEGAKDLSRLAHFAEGAGDRQAILEYARAAGKEAAALGMHRAAARLYALSLEHADKLPLVEQIDLNEAYARSTQGEPSRKETIAARQRAIALARQARLPLREGNNLALMSISLDMVDRVEESQGALDDALTILEPLAPNEGLAIAYRQLAYKQLKQGYGRSAVRNAEKSLDMARWSGHTRHIVAAFNMLGLCWLGLNHELACEYMERALAMAREHEVFWSIGAAIANLVTTYVVMYRLDRAEELVTEGITFAADHDMDVNRQVLEGWQAMISFMRGRWTEAWAQANELLSRPTVHPFALTPARLTLGRVLARRGQDGVWKWLDEALQGLQKSASLQRLPAAHAARTEAAWLQGDHEAVRREAREIYQVAIDNRNSGYASELAYWRWRAGESVKTYDWMVRPFVLEIEGNWREAANEWERIGCPYEQARALAHGDVEAQKAALVTFEELGAQPMAEWTRQKLREAGVQTIPRGPRADTRQNPFGLTNRQLQVLELLTEELTNAEIAERLHISPKTVDHHVSAVLARLDVSSREEAAALAQEAAEY